MVKHNCDLCGFSSTSKKDHTRHINTKKHLRKVNDNVQPIVTTRDDTPRHITKSVYACKYCDNVYTRSSSLMRHMDKCVLINNNDIEIEKDMEIKDIMLQTLENEIIRIQQQAKEEKQIMQKQLETYEHMLKSFTTPQTINYFNYIVQNYPQQNKFCKVGKLAC
jgi:uncharacterized Zn-finger protein